MAIRLPLGKTRWSLGGGGGGGSSGSGSSGSGAAPPRWMVATPGSQVPLRLLSARVLRRTSRRSALLGVLICLLLLLSPLSPLSALLPAPLRTTMGGLAAAAAGSVRGRGAVGARTWRGDDPVRFVNPLIGTAGGGHVFPGASLPYGMAKPGPDTHSRGENAAGFVSDANPVLGFSQLHDSGTGGSASLGNFPIFAHPGCPGDDLSACRFATEQRMEDRVQGSVMARAGYFSLKLASSVRAEMTASAHANLFRFTFPPGPETRRAGASSATAVPASPVLLVDIQDLSGTRSAGGVRVDPNTGRIVGQGKFRASFGQGIYSAYFCADFQAGGSGGGSGGGPTLRRTGTFQGNSATEEPKIIDRVTARSSGGWVQFRPAADGGPTVILARVGVSFRSTEQACINGETEIPDFAFVRVVAEAEAAWRHRLGGGPGGAVDVDPAGVSAELRTVFWSGLYRTMLSPQNYTGENPLWDSPEPYFDSFYCIWDSFRAQHPLLTIIDPAAQVDMIRALIDIYRNVGKLPDCRMSFSRGFTQGGSNADVVLADGFLKLGQTSTAAAAAGAAAGAAAASAGAGVASGVDWLTAYEAVVSDAEVPPPDFDLEGRGNLEAWHRLGYIPVDDRDHRSRGRNTRTVSRTLEYAYEDFAIALFGRALGQEDDYVKYLNRSDGWRNVWNPDQDDLLPLSDRKEGGRGTSGVGGYRGRSRFTGFPQPRLGNGTFQYQSTRTCSPVEGMHHCYLDTSLATYEGSPWLYQFYVPQNMDGLAALMGGRDGLADRLEYYHATGIAYLGNEQAFLTVFQFHYAARPGLSSRWVRSYIPSRFNGTVGGLPGNDDCAMGAFVAMAMMGFFPVAGQDVYLIVAPFFRELRLRSLVGGDDSPTVIRRVGEHAAAPDAIYIRRAWLNGRPYTRSWVTHDLFARGGVLELEVAREEGTWGTKSDDLPPSYPPLPPPHSPPPAARTSRSPAGRS